MTKKTLIRSGIFILLFIFTLFALAQVFTYENSDNNIRRLKTYAKLPEDMVDVVFIGTSGVHCYWHTSLAFRETGISSYPYSVNGLPATLYVNALDEALRTQDPGLVLIDTRAYVKTLTTGSVTAGGNLLLGGMNYLSPTWFKATDKMIDTLNSIDSEEKQDPIPYYIPFVKFHDKWEEDDFLVKDHIGTEHYPTMGFFYGRTVSATIVPQTPVEYDSVTRTALDPIAEEALYEMIEYARENDVKLVFVDTPKFLSEEHMGRLNTVHDILDEAGIDYIDYHTPGVSEAQGLYLDPNHDFYNESHVNYYGAKKFTVALANYLSENYDVPDRRGDEVVEAEFKDVYWHVEKTVEWIEKHKDD